MAFYSGIAPYYDLIFPYDPVQVLFLEDVICPDLEWAGGIRDGRSRIAENSFLDIGCGTGTTLSAFTNRFKRLVGIDLNESLLERAAEKIDPCQNCTVQLLAGDMRELVHLLPEEKFSMITCLGNTLVHLTEPGSLAAFLKVVNTILEPDGVFVFQIMNYDRILNEGICDMKPIIRDKISFECYYSTPNSDGLVSVDTLLADSEIELEIKTSISLFPVQKMKIQEILHVAGFPHCSFYGDFTGSPWSAESSLCIGVCER